MSDEKLEKAWEEFLHSEGGVSTTYGNLQFSKRALLFGARAQRAVIVAWLREEDQKIREAAKGSGSLISFGRASILRRIADQLEKEAED